MEMRKFCKDCKWCPSSTPDINTKCGHAKAGSAELYLVTGDLGDLKGYSCHAMRAGICKNGSCLWEARDEA